MGYLHRCPFFLQKSVYSESSYVKIEDWKRKQCIVNDISHNKKLILIF